MTMAERISDKYVQTLDMARLSTLQVWMLHGIKSVAMGQWARAELASLKAGI